MNTLNHPARSEVRTVELDCPTCSKTLQVSDSLVGERLNCPSCGSAVEVPRAEPHALSADPGEIWLDATDVETSPDAIGAKADTKTCPMCGEVVKAVALKCRFCGEDLAGCVGPDSRPGHGIWRDGDRLVMSKGAQLPFVCVKTNLPADAWLRRNLYWHSPWLYLLILISIWIYIIVGLIVRKRADIRVGLCRAQLVRRRWVIAFAWLAVVAGGVLFCVGIATNQPGNNAWVVAILGLVILLAGAIAGARLASIVRPVRITNDYAWIKGVHPLFLASLPAFSRDV